MGEGLETIVLETVGGDVAFQMALNEAIMASPLPTKNIVVRLIEFSQSGITLGRRQSFSDVKPNGLQVTRRQSVGSAMLCNHKQIYFAIFGPHIIPDYHGANVVHRIFGRRLADALKFYGIQAEPSAHYYVKVGGKAIAGSAQKWELGKTWLYEGVLTVEPWRLAELQELLHLREGEAGWILGLPAVSYHDYVRRVNKEQVASAVLAALAGPKHKPEKIPEDILTKAKELREKKYLQPSWVEQIGGEMRAGLGFCLCGDMGKS